MTNTTNNVKKVTKADNFNILRAIVLEVHPENEAELITFIDHELEMLANRNSRKTETKAQKENAVLLEKLTDALRSIGKAVTVTELMSANSEMNEYSNQKLSALLTKLVKSGAVVRTVEKKKAYYSIAEQQLVMVSPQFNWIKLNNIIIKYKFESCWGTSPIKEK